MCVLCGARSSRRLQAVARHTDGFDLAEIDLRLRGEGEIAGHRQSGQAELTVARLPEDEDLLERARRWAAEIVERDPELRAPEHVLLAQFFERRLGEDARRPLPA
jgi:ATP-dependent DNA helicase RecG